MEKIEKKKKKKKHLHPSASLPDHRIHNEIRMQMAAPTFTSQINQYYFACYCTHCQHEETSAFVNNLTHHAAWRSDPGGKKGVL